jgi:hypothetical protein
MDFEAQFFSRMGMAFEWEQRDDPAAGEAALCHHLDNGRPAIVQTDIYHLPHYSGNTHFPGHLITVWGYDGTQGVFFITDTQFPDLIAVPFAGRNPPITRWRLKGFPNKTDDMVCEYFKQTCNTVTCSPFAAGKNKDIRARKAVANHLEDQVSRGTEARQSEALAVLDLA